MKENAPRKGFLRVEEFRLLQAELPAHLRAIITIAYFAGMRIGELKNLQWSAVNMLEGALTLHSDETKSGEARIVPLNHESTQGLATTENIRTSLGRLPANEPTCPD